MNTVRDWIECRHEGGLLMADGLDCAVIGLVYDRDVPFVAYSTEKILDKLMSDGMDRLEAMEYFEFNIASAYLGKGVPVFVDDVGLRD